MATIVAAASGGNWTSTTTWTGGVVPTSADDIQLTSSSGNVTIDAAVSCRSLDCTGYTGTLTHAAAVNLNIGDATAGAGNVALKFVGAMTYVLGNVASSAINFISTSATVQTVDFSGKTTGNIAYNPSSNGSWQMTGAHVTGITATVTFTKGTLDVNGQTCTWGIFSFNSTNTRVLTLGAANITLIGGSNTYAWDCGSTNLTLNANTSTITMTTSSNSSFSGGGKTYNNLVLNQSGLNASLIGGGTFANLTRNGTANRSEALNFSATTTITGTLTLNSNSSINRLCILSNNTTFARTISAGSLVCSGVICFMDITAAGTATWTASASGATYFGDGGGNTGITMTTPATQTWSGTSGGNWSANAWTSRVPLPQDDVIINTSFSANQTITGDMYYLGKSITWTGATGNPTWAFSTTSNALIFGSMTLIAGMTLSGNGQSLIFAGRAAYTITTAGKSIPCNIGINAFGGSYTFQDTFTTVYAFNLSFGSLNTNNYNVSTASFISGGSITRALTLGTTIWTLTTNATSSPWSISSTGMTFSGASATIVIGVTSTNTRTFVGGGFTYGALTYTVAGSTGPLIINGANTFSNFNFSDTTNARTLTLPSSSITTITSSFFVSGTAGKMMTINSSTPGTTATLSKSGSRVVTDYLSLQDSTATGGASWYAGGHSTNVSNNSGWIFAAPPVNVAGNFAIFN